MQVADPPTWNFHLGLFGLDTIGTFHLGLFGLKTIGPWPFIFPYLNPTWARLNQLDGSVLIPITWSKES